MCRAALMALFSELSNERSLSTDSERLFVLLLTSPGPVTSEDMGVLLGETLRGDEYNLRRW